MQENYLMALALIAVLGAAAQWLAWRLAIPSIILLLMAGVAAGPIAGVIDPDHLLGDLLFPVVSMSVALILFEGGLSLRLADLPKIGAAVRNLVTVGALVSWAGGTLGVYLILELPLDLSVLLGAILVVTGPTVIGPLLRQIRPTGAAGAVLRWEGIVIDPIGALLAVLVFEVIARGGFTDATAHVLSGVVRTVAIGGLLGLVAAALLVLTLKRYWIPDFLQNAVALTLVVTTFAISNRFQAESGLLAVTVMGIAVANQRFVDVGHIVEFKENLRVLLISALFIVLSARLKPTELVSILGPGLALLAVLVVVVRPLGVLVSTLGTALTLRERAFVALTAPRGIVAAAVSSIFALHLAQAGYGEAAVLVPATFLVIMGTVAVYAVVSPLAARWLGVADASPQGILFGGAQPWVRALATVLKDKGYRVFLVDTNRDNIAAARMASLPVYTGSLVAERLLEKIDLGGIGRLFAVTPNEWVNVLAVQRFAPIFGRRECYQIAQPGNSGQDKSAHHHLHGRWLFGDKLTDQTMRDRWNDGFRIKATPITESFDFEAFRKLYGDEAIPMLALDSNSKTLRVMTADQKPAIGAGQTLISMVKEPADASVPTG